MTNQPTTRKAKYLGRAATVDTYLLTRNPIGPRVIVHTWDDTGAGEVRAIVGDGRNRCSFTEYTKIEFLKGDDVDALTTEALRAFPS